MNNKKNFCKEGNFKVHSIRTCIISLPIHVQILCSCIITFCIHVWILCSYIISLCKYVLITISVSSCSLCIHVPISILCTFIIIKSVYHRSVYHQSVYHQSVYTWTDTHLHIGLGFHQSVHHLFPNGTVHYISWKKEQNQTLNITCNINLKMQKNYSFWFSFTFFDSNRYKTETNPPT